MPTQIFADPFGSLLQGIQAADTANLNEARLAADIQAEQNRRRSEELDRALRVELAQSDQAFRAASQNAQFSNQLALQQDRNQFTLGLEAQRELNTLQRERRQNDFTLQRDQARDQAQVSLLDRQNQFAVAQFGRQQAANRTQTTFATNEAIRQAEAVAQIIPAVDPAALAREAQLRAVSVRTSVVDADGNIVPAPSRVSGLGTLSTQDLGAFIGVGTADPTTGFPAPAPTPTSAAPVAAPVAALPPPPSAVNVAPQSAPTVVGGVPIGAPRPGAPTVNGQSVAAAPAVAASVGVRLRSGAPLDNTPGNRLAVQNYIATLGTGLADRSARRRAQAWLRANQ